VFGDLTDLFRRGLAASGVVSDETVAVYTEGGVRREYASAFVAAAGQLGATAFAVDVPTMTGRPGGASRSGALGARPVLVEAFRSCDLLVDLALLLFLPEKISIQESGTRILTCVEPPETIERLFPRAEYREEARRGRDLLQHAATLTVRSDVGTDVVYRLGDRSAMCQYGQADEPGRWDHFASAFVATAPNDQGVDGQVVLGVGDVVLPSIHYVRDPVVLTIEKGHVAGVAGGVEAMLIREQMDRSGNDSTAVSHVGWGLHEQARWEALRINPQQVGLDARSFRGNVMFSTGPDTEFGGTNISECHFDMPMRNCSLWVDDELIVDKGVVVPDWSSTSVPAGASS
jgi:2,5-dihydroxypyridine 5,6-dioxygenase